MDDLLNCCPMPKAEGNSSPGHPQQLGCDYLTVSQKDLKYTPQNNLRTTQWTFPYVVYWVSSVAQTRQDIEKRFSVPLKGVKIKCFP